MITKEHSFLVVAETLDRVNNALIGDPNALVTNRAGAVSPESAYIELVRELMTLVNNLPRPV